MLPRLLFRALGPGLLVTAVALVVATLIYWIADPSMDWRSLALICLVVGAAVIFGLVYRPENRGAGTAPGYHLRSLYADQAGRDAVGSPTSPRPVQGAVADILNLVPIGVAAVVIIASGAV